MCQDTGTAIVMGKKGERVLTGGHDEEAISAGVYDAYTQLNLRYSQMAPHHHVGGGQHQHQPAGPDRDLLDVAGDVYELLFMAKGGARPTRAICSRRPRLS